MIHVCYLISSLANEGPTNVMYNIIKNMDYDKFKVSVITLIPEKDSSRKDDFSQLPIDIYQLCPNKSLNVFEMYKELKKTVCELQPQILHTHCARSLFLMCFMPKRYMRVHTIHGYPGYQHIQQLGQFKGRIIAFLTNFFVKKCDLPIGCAKCVGWMYKQNKGWNIKCIPNGASMPIWAYNEREKRDLRNELGLQETVKYFIFVGRFSKEKNPDILVDVFNEINDEGISLIMLGDGVMWDELKFCCNKNIIMVGFTKRVYDYLKASDFYISTSDAEGLANTLLESMSVGLPMILSDIPSHREVMENFKDGSVGFIVNQHDVCNIVEKIHSLLEIEPSNIRSIIQKVYSENYTARIMSENYQDAYMELFNKG